MTHQDFPSWGRARTFCAAESTPETPRTAAKYSEPPASGAPTATRARSTPPPPPKLRQFLEESPTMAPTMRLVERLAPTAVTVTIFGETGTGKDVVARLLHEKSQRRDKPFVVFDCGAVASTLAESELLGHEKGSFTGAFNTYNGAFERANGGTLFLDEIGELPLDLQPRLLRALENRQIRRVGGSESRAVDVRVIAATNRDLLDEVRQKRFREDLYYRLVGASISLPGLRARKDDLPQLCRILLQDLDAPEGKHLTPRALSLLTDHDWPGNVRELKNVLACAIHVAPGNEIGPEHLDLPCRSVMNRLARSLDLGGVPLSELERLAIEQTLRLCRGQKAKAAEALGIALSTLYEKLKRYQLG